MIKFTLLILILSFSALAQTTGPVSRAACTDIDIRDRNPNIRNNPAMREHYTTPRNQDSIGWCYAFAAADLVSAELTTPLSSLHTSLIYNKLIERTPSLRASEDRNHNKLYKDQKKKFERVYESGSLVRSLDALKSERRVCPERLLPFDQHKGKTTIELIRRMEELKKQIDDKKIKFTEVCSELREFLPTYGINQVDIPRLGISLLLNEMNTALSFLAQNNCRNSLVTVPNFKIQTLVPPTGNPDRYFLNLNTVLNAGKPLAISYDVKHISRITGNHASIVMGRRWKNGRCEYKIRNSWGKSCASYNAGIECNKAEGAFWVKDDFLLKNITSARYLLK